MDLLYKFLRDSSQGSICFTIHFIVRLLPGLICRVDDMNASRSWEWHSPLPLQKKDPVCLTWWVAATTITSRRVMRRDLMTTSAVDVRERIVSFALGPKLGIWNVNLHQNVNGQTQILFFVLIDRDSTLRRGIIRGVKIRNSSLRPAKYFPQYRSLNTMRKAAPL